MVEDLFGVNSTNGKQQMTKCKYPIITVSFLGFVVLIIVTAYSILLDMNANPKAVWENLNKAKSNYGELTKAIRYFQEDGSQEKLDALYFLIGNMDGHCYVSYAIYDSTETEIEFNVLAYPNYDTMVAAMDSLEDVTGELHYGRKEKRNDLEYITAEFLIDNVELAYSVWKNKPWAHHLSFDEFCEYILPYRGSNEPLEEWRKALVNRYKDFTFNRDDPISVSSTVNQDVKSWFGFDPIFYRHPTDQGFSEMLIHKKGRCEDMTNLAIYAMRANGLAVTSDYTPHWANTGNNHAWNAILSQNGMVIPFMGCEADPGDYSLGNKMAKAYRKTFSKQEENLAFRLGRDEDAPRWLTGKNYTDVTPDYIPVSDVTITLEYEIPDNIHYAYLAVFNSGEWRAIHWGEIIEDSVTFTDMGRGIAYIPMFYVKEELIPAGSPFILDDNGNIDRLSENEEKRNMELVSTTRKTMVLSTEGKQIVHFDNGSEYELFYWNNEWESLGVGTAEDKPLWFANVPVNRLYWLVKKDSDKDERIFSFENDTQIWW
ncbi:MAG: transglutaminase domain-containing protein [Candidatus Marinimicrobia bacterium]|nr:transglutaminase domain-containing protein [Candidatus Neomarinimicrobiota bacterium]